MKKILIVLLVTFFCTNSKGQNSVEKVDCPQGLDCSKGNVLVESTEEGSVYIDGEFTGKMTPCLLTLAQGNHVVGVGLEKSRKYLKKTVTVDEDLTKLSFSEADVQKPSVWRALFVGVPEVKGLSDTGECSTNFSQQDLDDAFDFFKLNMKEHIEPFSYGTIKWEIDRRDLNAPVNLTHKENGWYTLEAEQGLEQLDDIEPGMYDAIFLFWREEEGDCSFKSSYFGLAWLDPSTNEETKKSGYVTVKFNPGEIGVKATIDNYLNTDPGVWTHEWLHVVIEQFYPDRGVKVPLPPNDKLILHAAEAYGYKFPWINWYKDLISGQVRLGKGYAGIGPEAFLDCTIRQTALGECKE